MKMTILLTVLLLTVTKAAHADKKPQRNPNTSDTSNPTADLECMVPWVTFNLGCMERMNSKLLDKDFEAVATLADEKLIARDPTSHGVKPAVNALLQRSYALLENAHKAQNTAQRNLRNSQGQAIYRDYNALNRAVRDTAGDKQGSAPVLSALVKELVGKLPPPRTP
jgi:hypothetical protein